MKTCLTFDFDAMSAWIGSAKSRNPSEISRGEFGAIGITRILKLLEQLKIKSTFFVPGHTIYAYPQIIENILSDGHEIGHHGWIHENPANFDESGERQILDKGLEAMQRVANYTPVGYRSPAWDLSEITTKLLREYGFIYDSSLMGDDLHPYYLREGDTFSESSPFVFGKNVDLIEMPVHWSRDDFPPIEYVPSAHMVSMNSPSIITQEWKKDYKWSQIHEQNGVFILTLHPQVFGRSYKLELLENLLVYMKDNEASFLSMSEFTSSWKEENPLDDWIINSNSIHIGKSYN